MPPKGAKRAAAQAPAEQPEAKRLADALKKVGVSKPKYNALVEIVDHDASQGLLPEGARKMLSTALEHSICVPSDQRTQYQSTVVEMLSELTEQVEQKLQDAAEAEEAHVTGYEDKRRGLEGQVQAAEAALAEAAKVTTDCKTTLTEATAVFCDKKATLLEKQTEQRKGDAELVVVRADKETLEAVHGGSFQKLKGGECEPGKVDALYGEVKSIIGKLPIEDSLLTALKSTLTKPPSARGPFDVMVVGQFEEALLAKIGELAAAAAGHAAPAAERAAAVEQARAAEEQAKGAQQAAATALQQAQEAQAKAKTCLDVARQDLEAYGPEYSKAVTVRDAKREEHELFRDHNAANFAQLRDRVSKEKEAELAAAEAEKAMEAEAGA